MYIRRIDAEAEAPVLWPPDAKSWLTGKNSGAEKDWGQEKKGMTEDEMVVWHHWLSGHESEQTLVCWRSCGHKESDVAQQLNNNTVNWKIKFRNPFRIKQNKQQQNPTVPLQNTEII